MQSALPDNTEIATDQRNTRFRTRATTLLFCALYLCGMVWLYDPYWTALQSRFKTANHWHESGIIPVMIAVTMGITLSLLPLLSSRYRIVRGFGFGLVFVSLVFSTTHERIAGHAPTAGTFEVIKMSYSNSSFLATYYPLVLREVSLTILAMSPLIVASFWLPRFSFAWCLAPLASFGFAFRVIYTTMGQNLYFPSFVTVPALAAMSLTDSGIYLGPREAVSVSSTSEPHARHVILIVDESVRGRALSINGGDKDITPYLTSVNQEIVNFGICSSSHNCSIYADLILRSGLREDEIPDLKFKSLRQPDIFQFAKSGGFSTHFIDGQLKGGTLSCFMTPHDLENLDSFCQFDETLDNEIAGDQQVADAIVRIIKENERSFTYAMKRGVHFPYEDSYPATQRVFSPTLDRDEIGGKGNKDRMLNSYHNGVRWRTDEFLRYLRRKLEGNDFIIVYTSDHGQNILDSDSLITHCQMEDANAVQAEVPLLVIASSTEYIGSFSDGIRSRFNQSTHFAVFPTLLEMLGYDRNYVLSEYGRSLFMPIADRKRQFYIGDIFGRRGQGEWIKFDGE